MESVAGRIRSMSEPAVFHTAKIPAAPSLAVVPFQDMLSDQVTRATEEPAVPRGIRGQVDVPTARGGSHPEDATPPRPAVLGAILCSATGGSPLPLLLASFKHKE